MSPEQVQQAVAEAPLLAPEGARALLTEAARRGQVTPHALDAALFVAGVGFQDLDRAMLDELGELVSKSWSSRSAADQGRIQAYMRYARAGEPLSPEAVAAGRVLLIEGVRSLPATSQGRLSALFTRAVDAGIRHQQQAQERARVAALTPLPAIETPPPAPAADAATPAPGYRGRGPAGSAIGPGAVADGTSSRDPSTGGSESYWRSRAAGARAAIAAAEKRVRDLEEKASHGGRVVAGPLPPACQAGAPYRGGHASGTVLGPSAWERTTTVVECDYEILRQQQAQAVQTQLEAARNAVKQAQGVLDALEEEARRAGALPGWLR